MDKIKVIDFDGKETIYEAVVTNWGRGHGITAIGYYINIADDIKIIVHPETVKRIEIYEGDKACAIIEQRSHGNKSHVPPYILFGEGNAALEGGGQK